MGAVRAAALLVAAALTAACGSSPASHPAAAAPPTTVSAVPTPAAGESSSPSTSTSVRATTTTTPATTAATSGATTLAAAPCTGRAAAPATYDHVLVVVMENHGYADVAAHSPYLNRLASQCGLATQFRAVAHPSLPNYLALTSGSTQGVTDDCTSCSSAGASIFGQLAGGWKAYEEDLPSAGFTGASSGRYAKKHNPAAYFTAVASAYATQAVPMGTPTAGALADDLAHDTLPRFGFLTPNLCNDEHDCPIATGDAWLSTWVPKILASPAYQAGRTALFVTYDEDDTTGGNRIYTVVVAPSVPAATSSDAAFDHYSLLATFEDLLGLDHLGNAATATSLRAAFHL
jgi:acid phosphatase